MYFKQIYTDCGIGKTNIEGEITDYYYHAVGIKIASLYITPLLFDNGVISYVEVMS
ncbi:MAG: hypothetical protein HFJ53_03580 [Clostridia bacterium]|nr:hypothetical protein [Clostridia bacterium]